jgi:phosphate transport system substrate-binding protein
MRQTKCHGISLVLCFVLGLSLPAGAESLSIGGTGSSEPLVKLLFEEFSKQAPGITFNVVSPALGSGGGINALSAGKIDLAISARPLKAQEAAILGRHFEFAATPFVLVSNGGQRANGFALDALASVYDGRLRTWDNGAPIRLVLRTHDDADSAQLKSISPAMDKAVTIADQRPGMVYGNDDLDTLALLTRTTGTLGPTSLGLLRTTGSRLTVLALNGVMPSVAALKNGSYPWRKTLSVVLPLKASPVAVRFADFIRSSKASEVMLRHDYLPAGP